MPRWLLFVVSLISLVVLTYAGIVLAFSVPVTDEMVAANPSAPAGSRAVVVPVVAPEVVGTLATNRTPSYLMVGDSEGSFPTSARNVRMGQAIAHVPAGSNGTLDVANMTFDLANMTEGHEGWIIRGENETEAWFATKEEVLGEIARYESPGHLTLLFSAGGLGFVAPLITIVATHRGGKRPGAPELVCRECRAPLASDAEFCMRCGAFKTGP